MNEEELNEKIKNEDMSKYDKEYSDNNLFEKVAKVAKKVGEPLILMALTLYYVMKNDDTPAAIKAVILSGLAYFISPLDILSDPIPFLGYLDDLLILTGIIKTIDKYNTDDVKAQVTQKMEEIFGQ